MAEVRADETFDEVAGHYRQVVEESVRFSGLEHDFFMRAKARVLEAYLRAEHGEALAHGRLRALDVGCGVGAFHRHVRSLFGHLTGVDVSAQSIAQAQATQAGADRYLVHDGKRLPFADGSFDFTYTICVMHHVPPEQWQDFMNEMVRVTRPGGTVAVIEHNPFNPLTRLAVARCPFDRDAVLLRRGQVQRLMRSSGLQALRGRYFLFLPREDAWAQAVENALGWLALGGQYVQFGKVAGR